MALPDAAKGNRRSIYALVAMTILTSLGLVSTGMALFTVKAELASFRLALGPNIRQLPRRQISTLTVVPDPRPAEFESEAHNRMLTKEHSTARRCVLNLRKVGFATRTWAGKHDNRWPAKWEELENQSTELSLEHLVCPADLNRQMAPEWSMLNPLHVTYVLLSPNAVADAESRSHIYGWCPIHQNALALDGSVLMSQRIVAKGAHFVPE